MAASRRSRSRGRLAVPGPIPAFFAAPVPTRRSPTSVPAADADLVARRELGLKRLRPAQREAVDAVVNGRDTLAILATGSGKSAIYQVAGLLIPGPTLVVSPLLALQRDQVDDLLENGASAAALSSRVGDRRRRAVVEQLERGELEFLLLAPEQLERPDVVEALARAEPSLLVVDEAHCVTEWGHDFRPSYLGLGRARGQLGDPPLLALTATAAPPVRDEIAERLAMHDPAIVVRGFDRPNLDLGVVAVHDEADKLERLRSLLEELPEPGIVYAATRRRAERIADALVAGGIRAHAYHAGLRTSEREEIERRFLDGATGVIVATTAFGMGIDKPDVRFVIHDAPSQSLDAYAQEIGRAGRDDQPATIRLLYRPADLSLRSYFAAQRGVGREGLLAVGEALADASDGATVSALEKAADRRRAQVVGALAQLEAVGAAVHRRRRWWPGSGLDQPAELMALLEERRERRTEVERRRVEMMRGYAETSRCRRQFLLNYFGEPYEPPCGACDNCHSGRSLQADDEAPIAVGARVRHEQFGAGTVTGYEDGRLTAIYDEGGYRTVLAEDALARGILRPEAGG